MKEITLSNSNNKAIVDDEDFLRASIFRWIERHNGKQYYRYVASSGRPSVYLHRFIIGAAKGTIVDHINGDRLDNRKSNLRIVDKTTNARNCHKVRSSTGFRGVYLDKHQKKFMATIALRDEFGNKKYKTLGRFNSVIDAAAARDDATRKYYNGEGHINLPHQKESA